MLRVMTIDVPVLIAGGGPVGLTLGHELAHHGIRSMVVERNGDSTRHPKMDLTNSRSMELYARLGLDTVIRDAGVPRHHPFDVVWATSPMGHELHRFRYPSPTEVTRRIRTVNDGTMAAQAPLRISQIVVEPALRRALEQRPEATVRFGWALEDLRQDNDGVTATLRGLDGSIEHVRARYLVGCDGGASTVRHLVDIDLEGDHGLRPSFMVHFRSRRYDVLQRYGIVWHNQAATGTLIAQDDDQYWTLQTRVPEGTDGRQLDPATVLRSFIGADLDAEILVSNPWVAHLLVARSYRRANVFLCGDAVHQVIPTGGYGMNTGVGDAVDLGWKLAAVLQGWGGAALLDSYEAERRPVALRNREGSRTHAGTRARIAQLYAAAGDLEDADNRARLATQIAIVGNAENECWGLEHGFIYDSAVIAADETTADALARFDPLRYHPTTAPGARLPSVQLGARGLYDELGRGFTLVRVGGADAGDSAEAAAALGIPLTSVSIDAAFADVYDRPLLLVRPDHHIAWSGTTAPSDWRPVFTAACGLG